MCKCGDVMYNKLYYLLREIIKLLKLTQRTYLETSRMYCDIVHLFEQIYDKKLKKIT